MEEDREAARIAKRQQQSFVCSFERRMVAKQWVVCSMGKDGASKKRWLVDHPNKNYLIMWTKTRDGYYLFYNYNIHCFLFLLCSGYRENMKTRWTDSQVFKRIDNLKCDHIDGYGILREQTIKSERIHRRDVQTKVGLIWGLVRILTQIFEQKFLYIFDGCLDDGGLDGWFVCRMVCFLDGLFVG